MLNNFKLIQHNGGSPENKHTLEGIQQSIDSGVYGIEIDIHFSLDSEHYQIFNEWGSDCYMGEPQEGNNVLLEEVFEKFGQKLKMIILDKPTSPEEFVILQDMIERYKLESVAVLQFSNPENLKYVRKNIKTSICSFEPLPDYHFDYYTMNPLGKGIEDIRGLATREEVRAIRNLESDPIVVGVRYSSAEEEAKYYKEILTSFCECVMSENHYVMLDYPRQFNEFLKIH